MESIHHLHPGNWHVSVQVVISLIVLLVAKYSFSKRHGFSDLPTIALDGKSAKETWLYNGRKAITEGVKLVRSRHHHILMQAD